MISVIKIGGNVVDNPALLEKFVKDFSCLPGRKVLIHGGGVMASQMQKSMGIEPVMIEGRRVTDEQTLKIVTMVYAGWCNKHIVALLQDAGCNALGLSGADGNAIKAVRRPPVHVTGTDGTASTVDYGFVGDVNPDEVNAGFLLKLISYGITPVECAITHDGHGSLLNTNADTVAASIAISLSRILEEKEEVELVYCFEKNGVLADRNDDESIIPCITPDGFAKLKKEGVVAEGMIPKLENSFKAIESGVSRVIIKHAANLSNDMGTVLKP